MLLVAVVVAGAALSGAAGPVGPYRLAGLELASGWVAGYAAPDRVAWPRHRAPSVRAALHEVLAPHLATPPCLVAFSGGRDSSVVLAVAVDLARRSGFALPVPVTRHHPGVASLDEESWQRRVLDHLGVGEWLRLPFGDELDVVGPVARRVHARHGVVWPAAAHTSVPLFRQAAGGSVLTGEGGDELFVPPRIAVVRAALRGHAPRRAGLRAAAARRVRRRRAVAVARVHAPAWLTPTARERLVARLADDEATAPWGLRASMRRLLVRRAWLEGARTLAGLAHDEGATVAHPLLDPLVLAAIHRASRPWGYADRTVGLHRLFADLLPSDVLQRHSKVVFNDALFTERARRLAASWTGAHVDPALADVERLRGEWLRARPSVLSAPLLQHVALATRPAA